MSEERSRETRPAAAPGPAGAPDRAAPPGKAAAPDPAAAPGPAVRYLDLPVGRFLDALSASTPEPSGGGVAALTVALAGGLCVMVAGVSAGHLPQAGSLAERARQLRDRAAPLAQADAEGYLAVLAALRARDEPAIQAALSAACAVPMQVAEIGDGVAGVAAALATSGKASVRGDAITAALLAAAGARGRGGTGPDQPDRGRQEHGCGRRRSARTRGPAPPRRPAWPPTRNRQRIRSPPGAPDHPATRAFRHPRLPPDPRRRSLRHASVATTWNVARLGSAA